MKLVFLFIFTVVYGEILTWQDKVFNLTLTGGNCTYKGIDHNARGGFVLYNNCSGNEFAWIQRLKHGYYLYNHQGIRHFERDDELPVNNKTCVIEEINDSSTSRRLIQKEYATIKIYTDNLRLEYLNNDLKLLQSSTVNILSMIQQIYTTFYPEGYRVVIQLDAIEHLISTTSYPWETSIVPGDVLNQFRMWLYDNNKIKPMESAILLSGTELSGSVIGIAYLGTFCKYGGVAVVESLTNDITIAKTAAHELGHNIGMQHTNVYNPVTSLPTPDSVSDCIVQYSSIMSAVLYGTGYMWDRCSYEWFRMFNEGYPYKCTDTCTYTPSVTGGCFINTLPSCGNTIIDPGEECDCGDSSICSDPCCDSTTCKLKGTCSPKLHQCCSDTCEIIKTKKICRDSIDSICDTEEYCDGEHFTCPDDKFNNYLYCNYNNIPGSCYNGTCLSHEILCNKIPSKYGYTIYGSCPRAIIGDVSCSKVYCQTESTGFCNHFYIPDLYMVPDGTPCGGNAICLDQHCIGMDITNNPTSVTPTRRKRKPKYRCRKGIHGWKCFKVGNKI